MKKFIWVAVMAITLLAARANATMVWTDSGDPWGAGLKVLLVYPEFPGKSIIFKCSDGKFYRFYWDPTKTEMTENAKAILASLLTAMVAEKNVNIFYNNADSGYITVELVNVHN